ncbi:MAG: ParB/RepB/Spo0J family partition protein, partial [Ruminococcus sp.]|nr:ParB/RepB/Spo0J family partition protein [Ruminococcus sp.]
DEDMFQLMESILNRGVVVPAVVRQKDDGRFELISGHRRRRASELLGLDSLRCQVVEMDDDEATIFLVESNYHRSKLLPSEKAKAYKMLLDALKRQGERTDLTSVPVGPKLKYRSNKELAEMVNESETQIKRYIRLTYLVPELLEMVNQDKMKMRPAVEISYLPEEDQRDIVEEIDINEAIPSHAQAIRMRKLSDEGKLTPDIISLIMNERKPNQVEKLVLKSERIRNLIPAEISHAETEEYVFNALKYYRSYLRKREDRER